MISGPSLCPGCGLTIETGYITDCQDWPNCWRPSVRRISAALTPEQEADRAVELLREAGFDSSNETGDSATCWGRIKSDNQGDVEICVGRTEDRDDYCVTAVFLVDDSCDTVEFFPTLELAVAFVVRSYDHYVEGSVVRTWECGSDV